jgi:hypothetical protein
MTAKILALELHLWHTVTVLKGIFKSDRLINSSYIDFAKF